MMDPPVVITGLGVVSPAGLGSAALAQALLAGRSFVEDLGAPWAPAPQQLGARVRELGARERIPAARLRRLGRLSQLAVVASWQALEQSGPVVGESQVERTGVVLGTGFGALEETVTFLGELHSLGPTGANPALFPASVMNVAAAHTSMELGLRGYNTTVNHKEISAEMAVQVAADALRLGHADRILVGGVDELGPALHHGYRRLGALAAGPPRPYRAGRDGLCLGEGAAVLALEPRAGAEARGAVILGELLGWGAAGSPRPLVGWGPSLEGGRLLGPGLQAGVTAVRAALAEAHLAPEQIDLVIGCGCGSPALDRLDAAVIRQALGERPVPVTSPHGALGTFASAGALRLASAVEVLRQGRIYPSLGEGEPDPELWLPGLVLQPREQQVRRVLLLSHATGGGSAALVVGAA